MSKQAATAVCWYCQAHRLLSQMVSEPNPRDVSETILRCPECPEDPRDRLDICAACHGAYPPAVMQHIPGLSNRCPVCYERWQRLSGRIAEPADYERPEPRRPVSHLPRFVVCQFNDPYDLQEWLNDLEPDYELLRLAYSVTHGSGLAVVQLQSGSAALAEWTERRAEQAGG